jgi:site-specific DNA-methyltransferase (adenine-specific)
LNWEILEGDSLEIMRKWPDNHFSAIVTDSPYGISFLGNGWDRDIPPIEYWKEMLRILKPGGHLIAAGLPRMMHRLICVIEDAGFQIRDLGNICGL